MKLSTETGTQLDLIWEPIAVCDAECRTIYWNKCAEDVYGFTSEESLGRNPHDLLQTETPLQSILDLLYRDGRWSGELVQHRKDGRILLVIAHWVLDRDESGAVRAIYQTSHDITRNRQKEDDLRSSRRMLAEAEALSNTGAWEWDLLSDRLIFSKEWQVIHGCRKESMNPAELLELAHPDDRAVIIRAFEDLRRGIASYTMEHRIIRQDDKSVRIIQARGSFIRGPLGKVIKVYGFARDITEQKQAEETVREKEQSVRRKLESILSPEDHLESLELADILDTSMLQKIMEDFYGIAHIPVAILDTRGRVFVGVGWQDVCTKFHRAQPEACRHCLESDTQLSAGIPQGEFRMYKCKNNLWDVATPIIVAGQHIGNIFIGQFFLEDENVDTGYFKDQAKRFGFNEDAYLAALARAPRISRETINNGMAFFRNLADTLSQLGYSNIKQARLLTERDRLTESLRRITDELKRSNEDLQQFAYAASHDLQEPLRIINGFLNLLEKHYSAQLDARAREYIGFVTDASIRMTNLIRDLLAYSRVESKKKELQPTDSESALNRAVSNLTETIRETGATVMTSGRMPVVMSDPSQLMQLFQNLLGNALKFRNPDRPCTIRVGAEKENGSWLFSVEDNGIGIEPQYRERIFAMFQRLHSSRNYQGTGIGLAICKRIVERHGGRIWVDSDPGQGSTFRFSLPVTADDSA